MNDQNLIPIETRTPAEQFAIRSKGGVNSQKKKKEIKEEEKRKKALIEILKEFLYTDVKPSKIKKLLKSTGANEENYFAALVASTMLNNIKKGEMNSLIKLLEVLGESQANGIVENENTKSFNNLIEAINNVRETK
jgi:hypothetical protein